MSAQAISQSPLNPSGQAPSEESSGPNWVFRARIASQIALPIIMNTAFVLAMVGSIAFPPVAVFFLIGIGVTAGLLWHFIPDPYAALGASSPQTESPEKRQPAKNREELKKQHEKADQDLQEFQAARRSRDIKADSPDLMTQDLDELESKEQAQQRKEHEIEQIRMHHKKAREKMVADHAKAQQELDERNLTSCEQIQELDEAQKSELEQLGERFARELSPVEQRLKDIKKEKLEAEMEYSHDVNLYNLDKEQKQRKVELRALQAKKDPTDTYKDPLNDALEKLDEQERVELEAKFIAKKAEVKDASEERVRDLRLEVIKAGEELAKAQKALNDLLSEMDPSLITQMGTAFRSVGASATRAAVYANGVIGGIPARVRGLLPSSQPIGNRLQPVSNPALSEEKKKELKKLQDEHAEEKIKLNDAHETFRNLIDRRCSENEISSENKEKLKELNDEVANLELNELEILFRIKLAQINEKPEMVNTFPLRIELRELRKAKKIKLDEFKRVSEAALRAAEKEPDSQPVESSSADVSKVSQSPSVSLGSFIPSAISSGDAWSAIRGSAISGAGTLAEMLSSMSFSNGSRTLQMDSIPDGSEDNYEGIPGGASFIQHVQQQDISGESNLPPIEMKTPGDSSLLRPDAEIQKGDDLEAKRADLGLSIPKPNLWDRFMNSKKIVVPGSLIEGDDDDESDLPKISTSFYLADEKSKVPGSFGGTHDPRKGAREGQRVQERGRHGESLRAPNITGAVFNENAPSFFDL